MPTFYKPDLPIPSGFAKPPAGRQPPANDCQDIKSCWKWPCFPGNSWKSPAQSDLRGLRFGLAKRRRDGPAEGVGLEERDLRAGFRPGRHDHGCEPELRALLGAALG